ncbi:hypothetical protein [Segetibacter aerophilus]|nr:hypothetical protein [Segetibacter aerophilus]
MKNLILSALLAVTVSTAFATGETKISYFVLNSFKHDFKDVTNVTWTSKTGLAKASFIYNNQKMDAFYNPNGSLFATSKNINLDELPVGAKRSFAKRYEGYSVKEAIKYESQDEQSYYISAENEKESLIIKIDEAEHLQLFKRIR